MVTQRKTGVYGHKIFGRKNLVIIKNLFRLAWLISELSSKGLLSSSFVVEINSGLSLLIILNSNFYPITYLRIIPYF